MLYKTHIAGGLALGYIAFNNINMLDVNIMESKSLLIVTSGLTLGSLFPDIDHKNSYLSRKIRPISFVTSKIFKHREFTHSIVGTISVAFLLNVILEKVGVEAITADIFLKAFTIGVVSHILLDMMTISGVVLLYPFYKKRIRIGKLRTGKYIKFGFKEILILVFLILLACAAYTAKI